MELESIQERYIQVLRSYLQSSSPQNPQARLSELLSHIPEVSLSASNASESPSNPPPIHPLQIQAAASLLLESKMFYVPFVLNSASIR